MSETKKLTEQEVKEILDQADELADWLYAEDLAKEAVKSVTVGNPQPEEAIAKTQAEAIRLIIENLTV